MNIMNGSLKGRVYEGLERRLEKEVELASVANDGRRPVYRVSFAEQREELYKAQSREGNSRTYI